MELEPNTSPATTSPSPGRRNFLKEALALVIGGLVGLVPGLAGLGVLLDPLRKPSRAGLKVRVATLGALPEDGVPRKFSVVASRTDAWNRTPDAPIGAVYLRRTGAATVEAFNVVCPHAGCFVDYLAEGKSFLCPCHNSAFGLDGKVSDPKSPSPRGLDSLVVEVRAGGEVWVEYRNFLTGHAEKIPQA